MMLPPAHFLDLHKQPATRPVYDIPPIISSRPSYRPFRAFAALLTSRRSRAARPASTNR
jgi:hypothetical protein